MGENSIFCLFGGFVIVLFSFSRLILKCVRSMEKIVTLKAHQRGGESTQPGMRVMRLKMLYGDVMPRH